MNPTDAKNQINHLHTLLFVHDQFYTLPFEPYASYHRAHGLVAKGLAISFHGSHDNELFHTLPCIFGFIGQLQLATLLPRKLCYCYPLVLLQS